MRRRDGFSLLEFLLAVLFFSAIVVWVLYTHVIGLRAVQEIELRLYVERGVVEYQLEVLRGRNVATLTAQTDTPFVTPLIDPSDVISYPLSKLSPSVVTRSVYSVADLNPSLKQVTVTVDWKDPFGRPRRSVGTTLIGLGGLTDPGA